MTVRIHEPLPFIDTHEIVLAVDPARAWTCLQGAIARNPMFRARGFPEREMAEPRRIRLAGAHPFARYELCFDLEALPGETRTRVRATTHARFRRGLGRVYRAMVIGSGAHAWIMRRFLRRLGPAELAA